MGRLTDIKKYKNYLEIVHQSPKKVSTKIDKDISSRVGNIPKFVGFHEGTKPTNRLTDIQEIQNYLELVYKHPRNVSKGFQKDILSSTPSGKDPEGGRARGNTECQELACQKGDWSKGDPPWRYWKSSHST